MTEVIKNGWGWVVARLQEPSSWIGLCSAATMVGVYIDPAMKEQIIMLGVALGSFLAFILKERKQ